MRGHFKIHGSASFLPIAPQKGDVRLLEYASPSTDMLFLPQCILKEITGIVLDIKHALPHILSNRFTVDLFRSLSPTISHEPSLSHHSQVSIAPC